MEVNMINNNDMVDAIKIKHFTYRQCLFSNVLHNHNFSKLNIPLGYFFRWRYEACISQYTSFKANRIIY